MSNYSGKTGWDSQPTTIKEVIFSENDTKIHLEFETEGWLYTVELLQSSIGYFKGSFTKRYNHETFQGRATANLFVMDDGKLLFGEWREDNNSFTWWVRLVDQSLFD